MNGTDEGHPKRNRRLRRVMIPTVSVVALAALAHAISPIQGVSWEPPPRVALTGALASNAAFSSASMVPLPEDQGAESITAGPDGWLYTGAKSGKIYRFRNDGSPMQFFAQTGGRPNGMAFNSDGDLLVADSFKGLLSISPTGVVSTLATSANGQDFVFPDGLAVTSDGLVWFTDASARFPDGKFHLDVIEGIASGRLLTYNPETSEVAVILDELRFPNGITFGPDEAFILINESLGYRTLRYWLRGPKAGELEQFGSTYAGLPDDISFNGDGLYWIAFASRRITWVDWLHTHPALKKIVATGLGPLYPDTDVRWTADNGFVIAVDLNGRVVHNLQDDDRKFVGTVGVLEHDGSLFVGSITEPSIAKITVSDLPPRVDPGSTPGSN